MGDGQWVMGSFIPGPRPPSRIASHPSAPERQPLDSGLRRNDDLFRVTPAEAGVQGSTSNSWIPAPVSRYGAGCAGMTSEGAVHPARPLTGAGVCDPRGSRRSVRLSAIGVAPHRNATVVPSSCRRKPEPCRAQRDCGLQREGSLAARRSGRCRNPAAARRASFPAPLVGRARGQPSHLRPPSSAGAAAGVARRYMLTSFSTPGRIARRVWGDPLHVVERAAVALAIQTDCFVRFGAIYALASWFACLTATTRASNSRTATPS